MKKVVWLDEVSLDDVSQVGGKNASLGEMLREMKKEGILVPEGFALTAEAYFYFLKKGKIWEKIKKILSQIDIRDIKKLQRDSRKIRQLILKTPFPKDLKKEVLSFYKQLSARYGEKATDVAVRSSGTAEDLPSASFAGIHETFLNVKGKRRLLKAIKKCFASLFLPRAISYREEKGFDHFKIAISVGVQKMVRSDLACSGVLFTLDTESGFPDVCVINGTWGLGEMIVKGRITPDEFFVAEKMLEKGYPAIIKKKLGSKRYKMVYARGRRGVKIVETTKKERESFVLSDKEILTLAKWGMALEKHYSKRAGEWRPLDIEWAKDGKTGKLYFVQARPETVHRGKIKKEIVEYHLKKKGKVLVSGIAVGQKIGQGRANVIKDIKEIGKFKKGEVLVTRMTDPDWEPIMKIASAIVTDEGSRVCHAAIVSRELGIPCVVGTKKATEIIKTGQEITVDCSQGEEGFVLEGKVPIEKKIHRFDEIPKTKTKICLNIGSPEIAFRSSFLPVDGVGLAREEFIFASEIKVHPLALINFEKLDRKTKEKIEEVTTPWKDKRKYFIDKLAQGVGRIATAFYPKEVIVRFSDFKSNEYAQLLGGEYFEPKEANPMIGWRGASRYYSEEFKEAFLLECKAIRKARVEFGLKNISVMVPFCRTPEEGRKVMKLIEESGLLDDRPKIKVYVMCEIPSNVVLAEKFLKIFDGFSIGSNDLTQLTLGLDRDSAIVASVGDERNEAVKILIKKAIEKCRQLEKYSGICGDAPSTFPEFAEFLVECGIESISVNPDVAIKTRFIVAEKEKKLKR